MSRFASDLDTRLVDEFDNTHQLLAPLVYESDLLGQAIVVPEGFITDFASVPRLPFAYLVVGGRGQRAAVIHDWLYTGRQLTREMADKVFAEALEASGYGGLVVGLMYAGVRVGGGGPWDGPNVPQVPEVAAQITAGTLVAP